MEILIYCFTLRLVGHCTCLKNSISTLTSENTYRLITSSPQTTYLLAAPCLINYDKTMANQPSLV